MKRHSSSDSLIPICPSASHGDDKGIYSRHFPSILDAVDDDECGEELCSPGHTGSSEKKRRLSTDQVRSLEKNFEVENKLDPERKVRLAQELGLQPRQVAVWFQNRRARWKTKQLERDYSALKASYDALRLDFDALHHDKQSLLAEIKGLKAKLANDESFSSVKEEEEEDEEAEDEPLASVSDIKQSEIEEELSPLIYKDGSGSGSSDSDSSAVLNDDTSPYYPIMPASAHAAPGSNTASAAYYPIMESRSIKGGLGFGFSFHHQLFKAEEHGFEEPCTNFFSDEQAPVLSWSCTDPWNWVDGGGGDNNNNNNNNNSNIGRRQGPF